MIHPLNNAKLEDGFVAYLVARLAATETTVPAPDGSGTTPRVAPSVLAATVATVAPENHPWVAVSVPETPLDAVGLYGDKMPVQIVAVAPFPYPPGIAASDHAALATAVASCFPSRPAIGAPDYETALSIWTARNTALSAAVYAAAGYRVNGWYIDSSRTVRAGDRIEEVLALRPCVYHPDVVAD